MTNNQENIKKAEALIKQIKELEAINTNSAYRRTKAQINRRQRHTIGQRISRVAAILILPLILAIGVLSYIHFFTETELHMATVTANKGTIVRFELPDKSIAWLHSGSTLTYPTEFKGGSRDVTLTGMGYFEVKASPEVPFYVHIADEDVKLYVYGTKFNVSAYPDDDFIEAVLEKGKVNMVIGEDKQYKMVPGEALRYDKMSASVTKKNADLSEKLAWREGKLVFRDSELSDVFLMLARHFNVDIEVNNPNNVQYRYHATFKEESIDVIFAYLSKTVPMTWVVEKPQVNSDGSLEKEKIIVNLK